MKTTQNQKIILFALVLLVGSFFILNNPFAVTGTTVGMPTIGLPVETETIMWNETQVQVSAQGGFKTFLSDTNTPFCGNNDGDIAVINRYDNGNTFELYTNMDSFGTECGFTSVTGSFSLPKGKITGECSLTSKDFDGGSSSSFCEFDGVVYSINAVEGQGVQTKKTNFEVVLNSPRVVDAKVGASGGIGSASDARGSARLRLTFKESSGGGSSSGGGGGGGNNTIMYVVISGLVLGGIFLLTRRKGKLIRVRK